MKHTFYPWAIVLPVILAAAPVCAAADGRDPSMEPDTDRDGMRDAYELFFGLDAGDPADALLDYDGDRLLNVREGILGSDPFAADTDCDGFDDDLDANPVSRFYIQWGSPWFTDGDYYDYARPDYFLGAWKEGGKWFSTYPDPEKGRVVRKSGAGSTQSGWRAAATESNMVESINVALDRAILTNNLVYAIHYFDRADAALYTDLLDADGVAVATDLYGNLMGGSNEESVVLLDVPTGYFTNAAVIRLRRGVGSAGVSGLASSKTEVVVYEGLLYIDEDGDGLDADAERQMKTSDYSVDSNTNGVGDYEECFHTTNNVAPIEPKDPEPDDEDQGVPAGVIYVDQVRGDDSFSGRAAAVAGRQGPKKTVRMGLAAVDKDKAHTLVIKSGTYRENLNISGKNIRVIVQGKVKL